MSNNKNHLRTQMKIVQSSILRKDRQVATKRIADFGEDFIASGGQNAVAGFFPVGDEITPLLLMQSLFHRQLPLSLPKKDEKNQIRFYRWWPGAKINTSLDGMLEPDDTSEEVHPDYLLVPLLGFDRMGNRLGQGNGFYTRAISTLRSRQDATIIGVGFAEQELGLMLEDADEGRLDWIVTQNGLHGFTQ